MLALRDKAETYAPTLLEVAKLALERPLATLGLVGILESHQALRPRIERLLELRPRKPGGLSFAASLCLFAFGAIALPMGQAPARLSDKSGIARQTATSNPLAGTENNFDATNRIPVLSDVPIVGWLFRTNRNDALARMHESGSLDNSGPSAAILPKPGLSPETLSRIEGLRIETKSELVRLRALTEYLRQLPPDKLPLAIPTAELKETILPSLMDRLSSAEQNLVGLKKDFGPAHPEVLKATSQIEDLNTKIQTRIFGIMLGLKLKADTMEKSLEALDQEVTAAIQKDVERANGASNAQFTAGRFFFVDGEVKQPGQKVYLVNSTQDLELLRKALEELGDLRTKYTDSHPLVQSKLAVVTNLQARLNRSNNAVRRGSSNPTFGEDAESKVVPPSKLETRVIKLDPATLSQLIKNVGPVYQQSTVAAIQEYLRTVGVELGPTERIWYKEKEGTLIVTASASKMGVIEKALQGINISAAQVHIKARFVEVPSAWPDIMPPPSRPILTAGEARALLKTLTTASNVLDEVSITTLTGRAAEIQIIPDAPAAQSSHPLATQLSRQGLAPVATTKTLDVTPTLTDDGWQLEMKAAATVAEFIGFDDPGTLFTAPGQTPVPRYRHRELTASQERTRLWDGDSLVLQESMETSDTRHFVVLTATLIDPAGNRLHTDEEVERARSGK
jgi:hypothetical protein